MDERKSFYTTIKEEHDAIAFIDEKLVSTPLLLLSLCKGNINHDTGSFSKQIVFDLTREKPAQAKSALSLAKSTYFLWSELR